MDEINKLINSGLLEITTDLNNIKEKMSSEALSDDYYSIGNVKKKVDNINDNINETINSLNEYINNMQKNKVWKITIGEIDQLEEEQK